MAGVIKLDLKPRLLTRAYSLACSNVKETGPLGISSKEGTSPVPLAVVFSSSLIRFRTSSGDSAGILDIFLRSSPSMFRRLDPPKSPGIGPLPTLPPIHPVRQIKIEHTTTLKHLNRPFNSCWSIFRRFILADGLTGSLRGSNGLSAYHSLKQTRLTFEGIKGSLLLNSSLVKNNNLIGILNGT